MPIAKKNTELTKRITEKLGVKNNTARVYASLIKQMWLPHQNMPADMAFLKTTKMKKILKLCMICLGIGSVIYLNNKFG